MNRKCRVTFLFAVLLVALVTGHAFAALPFLTEDAETLGKGTSQVELWYEGFSDRGTVAGSEVKSVSNLPGATFGHGIAERLDLTLGFLRLWGEDTVDGVRASDAGSAAFTLSAKWNVFEKREFYVAVKPLAGYSYRIGGAADDHATSFGGWLIATREHEGLAVSLNAGYLFNDYGSAAERDSSRKSIWSLSALVTYEILDGLILGLDLVTYTHPDKAQSGVPAFANAGAIFSPAKKIDLSLGFKIGLTEPAPDFAGIAGVTFRF
ncbi:MAG TPA: transporter [Candidatus Deferrimicrobiaceae bacterium]